MSTESQEHTHPLLQREDPSGFAHIPLRLRLLQNSYGRAADETLAGVGSSLAKFVVLAAISDRPGINGAELARMTFQKPQSLAGIAGALEEASLVRRRPGRGRAFHHELTESGADLVARSRDALAELHQTMFQRFDADDIEAFAGAFDAATRELEALRPDSRPGAARH